MYFSEIGNGDVFVFTNRRGKTAEGARIKFIKKGGFAYFYPEKFSSVDGAEPVQKFGPVNNPQTAFVTGLRRTLARKTPPNRIRLYIVSFFT